MAYQLRYGDFHSGATDPSNILRYVPDSLDYSLDIKGAQPLSAKIHKDDLGGGNGGWRNVLKRYDTMILLVDTEKAWNEEGKILTGGYVNAVPADFGDTISITTGGLSDYYGIHAVFRDYNKTISNPSTVYRFSGATWQDVLHTLIKAAHESTGVAGAGEPPQFLRNVDGNYGAITSYIKPEDDIVPDFTVEVNPANYKMYQNVMDEVRDVVSNDGNEYRPKLFFTDSSMTQVAADVRIGSDTQPHINFDITKDIYLERDADLNGSVDNNRDYTVLSISINQNGDGYSNHVIAQSKAGDVSTNDGADLTSKLSTTGPKVLVDSFYNPGTELDTATLTTQMTKRLEAGAKYPLTAVLTIVGDLAVWGGHLGKKTHLWEVTDKDNDPLKGFGKGEELRISDLKITPSEIPGIAKIEVGFVTPAPRYPRLPREFNKNDPFGLGGSGSGNNDSNPVVTGDPTKLPVVHMPEDPYDDFDNNGNGQDVITKPISINWDGVDRQLNNFSGFWGAGESVQSGEGHTMISDDANRRWLVITAAHYRTKWPVKTARGYVPDIKIRKSMKFENKPDQAGIAADPWLNIHAKYGLTNEGGTLATLTWAELSSHALPDAPSDRRLEYENFNFGMYLKGTVANRTVVIFAHQLQLLSGYGGDYGSKLRSKNMAWEIKLDANYNPVGSLTYTDNHLFSGNAGYDGRMSFYAYGSQIASDTSGDIVHTFVTTPQGYPLDVAVPEYNANPIGFNYWANLNQGQYSVYNLILVKDWYSNKLTASVGPDVLGKNYDTLVKDDRFWGKIDGIEQSPYVYNLFSCEVVGTTIYATSLTSYGHEVSRFDQNRYSYGDYATGERSIYRAELSVKPVAISNWTQLFSGGMGSYPENQAPRQLNFFTSLLRQNGTDIVFKVQEFIKEYKNYKTVAGDGSGYEPDTTLNGMVFETRSILARNGAVAMRTVIPTQLESPTFNRGTSHFLRFTYGGNYQALDSFTDFMQWNTEQGSYYYPWRLQSNNAEYAEYAYWTWGGTVSNYQDTYQQSTAVPRSMRTPDFTVTMGGQTNLETSEYPSTSIYWRWETSHDSTGSGGAL